MLEKKVDNLEKMFATLITEMQKDRAENKSWREENHFQRSQDQEEYKLQREEDRSEYKEWRKESQKEIKRIEQIWRDAGMVQGEIVEESIMYAIPGVFKKRGKLFKSEDIRKRVKIKDRNNNPLAEYDVIAPNGNEVLVVEAKNKLLQSDVKKFLDVQLPPFKKYLPEYSDYKVIGAVGGMIVDKSVQIYAEKHGLYVFIQNGDNMDIMNDANFIPGE